MMLAGTREGSVAVLWNNFVSHTGCSYLSLCFGISKPTRMCLVHPVLTEQKTFKEGEKPRVLLLIPPTPLLLLPHQLWSPHSPSCPSLSNAGTRQVNIPWKICQADHFKRLPRAAKEKLPPQKTYQGFSKPSMVQHKGRALILWGQ